MRSGTEHQEAMIIARNRTIECRMTSPIAQPQMTSRDNRAAKCAVLGSAICSKSTRKPLFLESFVNKSTFPRWLPNSQISPGAPRVSHCINARSTGIEFCFQPWCIRHHFPVIAVDVSIFSSCMYHFRT